MLTHIILVTTDGHRPAELRRLIESIPDDDRILIALLEQCGSSAVLPLSGRRVIRLSCPDRIPLSVARNRLLDHLHQRLHPSEVDSGTRLILSDDDCWYGPGFFEAGREEIARDAILVHPAFDPDNGRAFAVTDVRRFPRHSVIPASQLLFCATSIGLDIPAKLGLRLRFNERIGLGCRISQGEETLFLFHALEAAPGIRVLSLNDAPVFHPHKMAANSRNHHSLAYFLGWCAKTAYPYAASYFRYKFLRSIAAMVLRPSALSLEMPCTLLKGYLAGRADQEQLGSPSAPNHQRFLTRRDTTATLRPRIAFLTPANPIDADSGGKQFTLDRLLGLAALADVDVFCLADSLEQRRRLSECLVNRPIFAAGKLKPRTGRHWLESILRNMPLSVWRNDVAELSRLVDCHGGTAYDAVYVDHWLMWPVSTRFHPNSRRILSLHNAEHLIFQRAAKMHRGILKPLLYFESLRVRRYIRSIGQKAAAVHSISEADRQELITIGIPESRITSILPCVDVGNKTTGKPDGRVLFAGTLTWAPNVEGLDWFLRYVLPDLRIAEPLQVVGGDPLPEWRQLPAAGKIEFLGRVPSVEPLYAQAGVLIAPVFSGSGIKLKIVNALSRGLPVVTTTCGIEGFPPGWEGAVRVSDDPGDFGRAVSELLSDTEGWVLASRQAKQYASRFFSTEAARLKLQECLNVSLGS